MADIIKVADYAVRLGNLLTSKAADIYIRLPIKITACYALLTKALLTGSQKYPDGYRTELHCHKI